jgi:hypothetical protein
MQALLQAWDGGKAPAQRIITGASVKRRQQQQAGSVGGAPTFELVDVCVEDTVEVPLADAATLVEGVCVLAGLAASDDDTVALRVLVPVSVCDAVGVSDAATVLADVGDAVPVGESDAEGVCVEAADTAAAEGVTVDEGVTPATTALPPPSVDAPAAPATVAVFAVVTVPQAGSAVVTTGVRETLRRRGAAEKAAGHGAYTCQPACSPAGSMPTVDVAWLLGLPDAPYATDAGQAAEVVTLPRGMYA